MEGNLQVAPGATLQAGYDFTIPGNNTPVWVTFTSPELTFTSLTCANGAAPSASTITVPMPAQAYNSLNGGNWYPQRRPVQLPGLPGSCHRPEPVRRH
jgi:hypothetical protein